MDRRAVHRLAEQMPEMRAVPGHQGGAATVNGRGQHRLVLFVQLERRFERRLGALGARAVRPLEHALERVESLRELRREVAARFLDDVAVHPAFVAGFDRQVQELAFRAVGLGGRE